MPEKNVLFNPSVVSHQAVIENLVEVSSPRKVYILLMVVASVIATLGLLNSSTAIVIGAMLVAPILWPVIGVAMGLLLLDLRMLRLSLISIFLSLFVAVSTAIGITLFYVPLGASHEILAQVNVNFMLPVALVAGIAVALAVSYENVKEAVPGVAISVALLPPLVTIGIGLGSSDWNLMLRAIELFFVNLFAIVVVSYFIFLFLGFHRFHRAAESASKKEETILKKNK